MTDPQTPVTEAGRRLLNWADSDMSPLQTFGYNTVAQAVLAIEAEARAEPTTEARPGDFDDAPWQKTGDEEYDAGPTTEAGRRPKSDAERIAWERFGALMDRGDATPQEWLDARNAVGDAIEAEARASVSECRCKCYGCRSASHDDD